MDYQRAHLYISGRVQGVFYRASFKEQADKYQITGWVQNLPDGRVEALIEGPAPDIHHMVQWAHQGPHLSTVTDVTVEYEPYQGKFTGFRITSYNKQL